MGTARRIRPLATLLARRVRADASRADVSDRKRSAQRTQSRHVRRGNGRQRMRLVSFSRKPAEFDSVRGLTFINSDIAFRDHYAYQGNFAGFTIWDVKNPAKPEMVAVVPCITSQGDPSIIGHLLFVSAEGGGNRNDCAKGGVQDPKDHMAGVRIYDVSNPKAPKLVKNVQTCKGSHTHTVIPSPTDKGVVYIYVSGNQGARPETELAGCNNGTDPADANELALSARHHQGAARSPREGRGRDRRADLHRSRRRRRRVQCVVKRRRRVVGAEDAAGAAERARTRAVRPRRTPGRIPAADRSRATVTT